MTVKDSIWLLIYSCQFFHSFQSGLLKQNLSYVFIVHCHIFDSFFLLTPYLSYALHYILSCRTHCKSTNDMSLLVFESNKYTSNCSLPSTLAFFWGEGDLFVVIAHNYPYFLKHILQIKTKQRFLLVRVV